MALEAAQAGADMVAPSDMFDGRVAAIRTALDGDVRVRLMEDITLPSGMPSDSLISR